MFAGIHTGYPPWRFCCAAVLLALATVAAFGCGTVWYKAGGTDSDYQAARDRCRTQGRAEAADFEQCMHEQGWIAKQFAAPAAPSDAKGKSVATEGATPTTQSAPAAVGVAPLPERSIAPPVQNAPSVQNAPAAQDAPSAEQPIVVKNWFKLGGTAEDLAAAKERCATKLGAADRSDPGAQSVTREMLDCLRNEGWHAF